MAMTWRMRWLNKSVATILKTLIEWPWIHRFLIPQLQRKTATIFKTPIELPSVSIYNDIDIWYSFFKLEYIHRFFIPLSQRRYATILKTLIKWPWVSIYTDINIWHCNKNTENWFSCNNIALFCTDYAN